MRINPSSRIVLAAAASRRRGVEELMKLLPATPSGLPERPAPPIKTETP